MKLDRNEYSHFRSYALILWTLSLSLSLSLRYGSGPYLGVNYRIRIGLGRPSQADTQSFVIERVGRRPVQTVGVGLRDQKQTVHRHNRRRGEDERSAGQGTAARERVFHRRRLRPRQVYNLDRSSPSTID